jgi:hypothetical protein
LLAAVAAVAEIIPKVLAVVVLEDIELPLDFQ